MATTKESLYESIKTTRKRYDFMKEQEIKDLKDVLKFCCGDEFEFDYEEEIAPYCSGYTRHIDDPVDFRIEKVSVDDKGVLHIFGSPAYGEEFLPQQEISPYKILPGQIMTITDAIFNGWCDIQNDLQV